MFYVFRYSMDKFGVNKKNAFRFHVFPVCIRSLLGHGQNKIGTAHTGIINRFIVNNEFRPAGASPCFRAIGTGKDDFLRVQSARSLSHDIAHEHHALAAASGETHFIMLFSHAYSLPSALAMTC